MPIIYTFFISKTIQVINSFAIFASEETLLDIYCITT